MADLDNSTIASLRLFLAATTQTALPAATCGANSDDKLLSLGNELERLWVEQKWAELHSSSKKVEEAEKATGDCVQLVLSTRARTIEGIKVKGRALHWCHGGNFDEDEYFDSINGSCDTKLIRSILRDILSV